MSICSYVNKISKEILYRVNNLQHFTDCRFLNRNDLSNITEDEFYKHKLPQKTYELCDLIYTISPGSKLYDKLVILLLECEEHEIERNLHKIEAFPQNI